MAGRLTRFLNLERARKPGGTPAHGVISKERFSGESAPAAPPADLFRAEREAQLDSGVEIASREDQSQPFLRCPLCEADNSKFAVRCTNCQARLDTEPVRQWNARLWAERQKQEALEPEPAAEQRLPSEEFAMQRAESDRAEPVLDDRTPLGLRLLQGIEDVNLRFAAAMGMVVTFLGAGTVVYAAHGHMVLQTAAALVAVSLFVLFIPGRSGRRSRFWDGD